MIPLQKQDRGSEVKTDATTHTPRKYKNVGYSHNEASWNCQGGSGAGLKMALEQERKSAWVFMVIMVIMGWSQGEVLTMWTGAGVI